MRVVIAIHPQNYPAPRWMTRLYRAAFLLMGGMASVCIAILLYAAVSIALGFG